MWRNSTKRVLCELLCCVGSGMASSASRYYRKGHFCDQFFTKLNDTECVCILVNLSEAVNQLV